MRKVKVGLIGCGNISDIYCKNMKKFNILDLVACADLIPERSESKAEKYDIPKACSVAELLADPEIEIVVNLTIPGAHAEVNIQALEAGKHVYVEKPLATTREDGYRVLELARKKGLRVGCAPDTFMGGGLQTCRKLIDDGYIGELVGATAFMMIPGHESWHPNPEFYYKKGGGPMFDMGPYYLTALVSFFGPVKRVTGSARISFPERTITSAPKYGSKIKVEVPTYVAGIMDFANGAIGTIITAFDVLDAQLPKIEVYGTEGSMSVPDPNGFGGQVLVRRKDSSEWKEVPLTHGYAHNSRGVGVADIAYSLLSGRKHRANGDMAYHVLDIMQGFHDASERGAHYELQSVCEQPAALPVGLSDYILDE